MTIGPFRDDYRWLSNFWEAPITSYGITYASNEHFYQSHKTIIDDEIIALRESPTPGKAKRLGNDSTLRDDWDVVKTSVMMEATMLKYAQNHELYEKLVNTSPEEIVEYNTWHDNFWGVCTCEDCGGNLGENHFGEILMYVRSLPLKTLQAVTA